MPIDSLGASEHALGGAVLCDDGQALGAVWPTGYGLARAMARMSRRRSTPFDTSPSSTDRSYQAR